MKQYAYGVDVGGTTVKLGLFKTDGTLLDKWEIPTRKEKEGSFILPDIAGAIKEKNLEKGISEENVQGIGIGVPGPVDPEGNVLRCVNLGWGVFNVEKALSDLTGVPVKAANDANAAALGEMWLGGGKGYNSIVMVTIGTGIGAGVIINGKILPGANGAAGEAGHISAREDEEEVCGCGNRGCIEQYASASGFARTTQRYLAEHPEEQTVLRRYEKISSRTIFDAAKEGDATALAMVRRLGHELGKLFASIACVVDPEAFIIGGGMSKAGPILTDVIEEEYRHFAFHASRNTPFRLATLENDAGICGCVKMVL